jgi:single-stranded DNA-binding protein
VYVEGRLTMNTWEGKDGLQRAGLSVTAWQVLPLGQIGRKPRVQSRGEDAFDDPLRF